MVRETAGVENTTKQDSGASLYTSLYFSQPHTHCLKTTRFTKYSFLWSSRKFFLLFLFLFFYWLCYYSCPISFTQLHSAHPLPPIFPPCSSCPWVILISSLASTFPTLFLPSPCLFSTYHLCYLFSVPFPSSPPPTPLLTTLHVICISMVLFLFQLFA